MPMFVKDVMTHPVHTINIDKSAKDAADIMNKTRRGALVVVRNNHPIGIVTADDIIYNVVTKNVKPSTVKVKEIYSGPIITISPDDTVSDASRKMRENRIKRLPAVKSGKLVGIISMTDIATVVPEFTDYLEERMKLEGQEHEITEPTTTGMCDNCNKYSDTLKLVNDQWLCDDCREEKQP
jgi:CBS domain-containing protein